MKKRRVLGAGPVDTHADSLNSLSLYAVTIRITAG